MAKRKSNEPVRAPRLMAESRRVEEPVTAEEAGAPEANASEAAPLQVTAEATMETTMQATVETAPSPGPDRAPDEAPAINRQEIPWKPPREGTVCSRDEARTNVNNLRSTSEHRDEDAGRNHHDEGTSLNVMYGGFAEVALGFPSFEKMCDASFDFRWKGAERRMLLADGTTREQAGRYRLSRALLGLELLPYYGLTTLEALENVDLPVLRKDGTAFRFPASVGVLRKALKLKKQELAEALAREAAASLPRSVRAEAKAVNAVIASELEKHPELASLHPTSYVRDGRVLVKLDPFEPELFGAVASLLAALRRVRRTG